MEGSLTPHTEAEVRALPQVIPRRSQVSLTNRSYASLSSWILDPYQLRAINPRYVTRFEPVPVESAINKLVPLAKIMGLEVENDIDELGEDHS
ncbi:hypothetical protein AVEN_257193-1 [Araneus ventricosus]|uniref:Uncharacterized protein n=1 Tax=Araneus ventricosus TaxID=182803 RepID=A0A4Y2F5T1_ARAVE|nr:hypothetical protein AVEN_257193-1 [Araneus ventricosus]